MEWIGMKWAAGSRGKRNRRTGERLEVTSRGRSRSRTDLRVWVRLIGIPVGILVALGLVVLGIRETGALLFSRNDAFLIRTLTLNTDDPVALSYLQGKRAIQKGANLFAFDIGDVREDFLRHSPNYRGIKLTRTLPDTLAVEVVPRQPLAVLSRRNGFAVDAEGCVFGQRSAPDTLPLISGYQGPFLNPGQRVQGLTADAVRLLDVWLNADHDHEMVVREVDVRGGFAGAKDTLRVTLTGDTVVDLAWQRSLGRGPVEREDLQSRILFLRGLLRRAEADGKRVKRVDLSLDDYRRQSVVENWN